MSKRYLAKMIVGALAAGLAAITTAVTAATEGGGTTPPLVTLVCVFASGGLTWLFGYLDRTPLVETASELVSDAKQATAAASNVVAETYEQVAARLGI